MASTASPKGLVPVKMLGGQYYTGSYGRYKIASAYGTAIFKGDVVKLVTGGGIEKDTGTTTATPIGVFMGVEYTDPSTGYLVHKQNWTADLVAADALAYVADDPDLIFEIQADEAVAATALNANAALVQTAGSAITGNSKVTLDGDSIADTATLPVRIVGFVNRPDSVVGDAYTDCLVIWNATMHQFRNATGLA